MDISAYNAYVLFNIRPPAQGVDNSSHALKVFGVTVESQKIQRRDEPPQKRRWQLCPHKRDKKEKQKYSEWHIHVCKQHSKELLYCYDCVEEEIEDWTFCWATVSSKIWYILIIFGLLRHSHSYIYLVKALIYFWASYFVYLFWEIEKTRQQVLEFFL